MERRGNIIWKYFNRNRRDFLKTTIATYGYSISRQLTKRLRWGSELTGSAATHVAFANAEMELLTVEITKSANQCHSISPIPTVSRTPVRITVWCLDSRF